MYIPHCFRSFQGFSVKDITDFMSHPAINEIAKKLSSNRFTGNAPKKYKVVADVLKAYTGVYTRVNKLNVETTKYIEQVIKITGAK